MKTNASKHKAMSYDRMSETEKRLEEEVNKLLEEAARVDAEEDARYGKGQRGDELPAELARRESRLRKIREAKAALEAEARAEAEAKAADVRARLEERARRESETGQKTGGRPPKAPAPEEAQPDPKAQRNFTDPESRIMPDGANKGSFVQGYNAQIAVDGAAQIIVAAAVIQATNDKRELVPMAERIVENCGRLADTTTADSGYFSGAAVTDPRFQHTNLLVPPDRQKHGTSSTATTTPPDSEHNAASDMRRKLATPTGRDGYRMRKAIVEPVFGQIKEARGFRRFLLRGLVAVGHEFNLIAMTHNLLKLFRSGGVRTTMESAAV
ncbi:MAG: transposase [Pseudomonadota bacterium]